MTETAGAPVDLWFCWRAGMRGPTPEVWHEEVIIDGRLKPIVTLAKYRMQDGDEKLSLPQLIEKYPAPEVKD